MTAGNGLQVLLVTPTGQDAALLQKALNVANVQSDVLKDVATAIDVSRPETRVLFWLQKRL